MNNYVFLNGVNIDNLRDDEEVQSDSEAFRDNVPEKKDGFVLTSRVTGV